VGTGQRASAARPSGWRSGRKALSQRPFRRIGWPRGGSGAGPFPRLFWRVGPIREPVGADGDLEGSTAFAVLTSTGLAVSLLSSDAWVAVDRCGVSILVEFRGV